MNRKKIICAVLVIVIVISGIVFSVGIKNINRKQKDDASGCSDGVCEVPTEDENGNQIYAISSPVGYHNVEMIKQAERLDTLDGKKIALVGGSFNADITYEELKACILKKYPTATIYMFDEVGTGGPAFIDQIHSTGVNRGVPVLRTAVYPGAFSSDSKETLIKNTNEKVWPEVEAALTGQITDEEIKKYELAGERPYDEIIYYGTYEEIQEFCESNSRET